MSDRQTRGLRGIGSEQESRRREMCTNLHRTHEVVATLHDDSGNVGDDVGIVDQLAVLLEEAAVHEVV